MSMQCSAVVVCVQRYVRACVRVVCNVFWGMRENRKNFEWRTFKWLNSSTESIHPNCVYKITRKMHNFELGCFYFVVRRFDATERMKVCVWERFSSAREIQEMQSKSRIMRFGWVCFGHECDIDSCFFFFSFCFFLF